MSGFHNLQGTPKEITDAAKKYIENKYWWVSVIVVAFLVQFFANIASDYVSLHYIK